MLIPTKNLKILFLLTFLFSAIYSNSQQVGDIDQSFNALDPGLAGADRVIQVVITQPDGKILIGGRFTQYGGTSRNGIARLNSDGSLDESFDPGSGFDIPFQWSIPVNAMALQPDGKIVVGGEFISYNGSSVLGIIRLLPDGKLDPSFTTPEFVNAEFGYTTSLQSLVLLPDGKIVIGGLFVFQEFYFEPAETYQFMRLNSNGSIDNTFYGENSFTGGITKIIRRPDNSLLVGGFFKKVNDQETGSIALFSDQGVLENSFSTWDSFESRTLYSFALTPDQKIAILMRNDPCDGVRCYSAMQLHEDGTLDENFSISQSGFQAYSSSGGVNNITIQQDGKLIITGIFTSFNNARNGNIVRLASNGIIDHTFDSGKGFNYKTTSAHIQEDGKILVVGDFTTYNGIGRDRIVRINPNGAIDESFNEADKNHLDGYIQYGGPVLKLSIQSDGKSIATGSFSSYYGKSINGIIRFTEDGALDETFNYSDTAYFTQFKDAVAQSDGKIYAIKYSSYLQSQNKFSFLRLLPDGSIDNSFDTGSGFEGGLFSFAVQPNGKILIGGIFTSYNGILVNDLIRLNTDGTLDNTFSVGTGFDWEMRKILILEDGKIIVAGNFREVSGQSINRIVKLNADGSIDPSFNVGTGATDQIFSIALQPDGKIIIGGYLRKYNGTDVGGIVRLLPDGTIDPAFNAGVGFNYGVRKVVWRDNKIYVVGFFTSYKESPHNNLIRLNEDGTYDDSFITGTGFDGTLGALEFQPDGRIMLAGCFFSYNGNKKSHVIRLYGDRCQAPNGLLADPFISNQIDLSWNLTNRAIEYVIERREASEPDFITLTNTSEIQFSDSEINTGTEYFYRVRAKNGNGISEPSETISVSTLITDIENGINKKNLMIVYPNPSTGIFNIMLDASVNGGKYIISNNIGQTLWCGEINQNENSISVDLSGYP